MTRAFAKVGERAPNLEIAGWAQGKPTNIDELKGNVVLVKVFQVNCPGCFSHGFPQAIGIYNRYKDRGGVVIGLATAFEDYDKNTFANLQLLMGRGEVIGATLERLTFFQKMLSERGQVIDGTAEGMGHYNFIKDGNRLGYRIPFPVAMDVVEQGKARHEVMERYNVEINDWIEGRTFSRYMLRGTPSSILIDKRGVLRHTSLGSDDGLEAKVKSLLSE
ncbi:MAG: redoxin domain-containing protein [Candidatus Micrarchaeota archaeon]|nr:redoxin domain-containing protein [Candidatus Micrarchaeota archaeon]